MSTPLLVAFDFDHTICDDNSDIVVRKLLPSTKIPTTVKRLYKSEGWTAYMEKIFLLLRENNVDAKQIKSAIGNIPPVKGIDDLLLDLYARNCEIIIISDSNSMFINSWLASHKLEHTVQKVYTNPAEFDENGLLRIQMYHLQDWCQLSEKNLCKGHILESHISEQKSRGKSFDRVVYVGDGKNDLCPVLRLSETGLAFPRVNFSLDNLLMNKNEHNVKCDVVPWETGYDIMRDLKLKVFS